jgi:hypothetical protein
MVILLMALYSAAIHTTSASDESPSNGTQAGDAVTPADTPPGSLAPINGSNMPDDNATSMMLPPHTTVGDGQQNATESDHQHTSPPTSPVSTGTKKEQTSASPTTNQTTASSRRTSTEAILPTSLNATTNLPTPDETTSATTPDIQPSYANPDSPAAATQLVIVSSCLSAIISLLLVIIVILVFYRNRKLPFPSFQNRTPDTQMGSTDHPLRTINPEKENTKPKDNLDNVTSTSLRYSNPYTKNVENEYVNRETVYENVKTKQGNQDDNHEYEMFDQHEAAGDSSEIINDYMNMSPSK